MKKNIYIFLMLLLLGLHTGCQKLDIKPLNIFENNYVTKKTDVSVSLHTLMTGITQGVNQHGHCWATSTNPTIDGTKTTLGELNEVGTFTSELTGLVPNTLYYVRAYVQTVDGVEYGKEILFKTLITPPLIVITKVNNISASSANVEGSTLNISQSYTQHGYCWAIGKTPVISDLKNEMGQLGNSKDLSADLSGLNANTSYQVRGYLIDTDGMVVYSNELAFTTLSN